MNAHLQERLNQIPSIITSEEFLKSQGLGNEIGFWIFEYAPEDELQVREHLRFTLDLLERKHSQLKVVHINLLQCIKDYLDARNFTDKSFRLQASKGNQALLKVLDGPLHMGRFAPFLVEQYQAAEQDIIFVSGIGSVWPMMRAHELLNALHASLGHRPLVLFYPGHYTGQSMSLFGRIPSKHYYRAFKLAP